MKSVYNFFSSVKLGIYLVLFYAVSVAVATFIENDFGTPSANWLVYKSSWFNLLNLLLVVNMIFVFKKYKMYRLKKLTAFTFHAGLVIVILGAGITRFLSYEGIMHIREGETSNTIVTFPTYLNVKVNNNQLQYDISYPVSFSELSGAEMEEELVFEGQTIQFKIKDFVPNASEKIVTSEQGHTIVAFTVSKGDGRQDLFIKEGELKSYNEQVFNFTGNLLPDALNFLQTDTGLTIVNPAPMQMRSMQDTGYAVFEPLEKAPATTLKLYRWGDNSMVISNIYTNSTTVLESRKDKNNFPLNALKLEVIDQEHRKELAVFGKETYVGQATKFSLNGLNYEISYGSKEQTLPFSLRLDNFTLERYPGSMSPSSYESFITLKDDRYQLEEKHQVYMNNVLSHDGIRFYQSSYDQDEQGTILSVNKDYMGTIVTYIGYFLLSLGMFLNIFDKNSRFRILSRKIKELSGKSALSLTIIAAFGLISLNSSAQVKTVDAEHAKQFGQLLVQDHGGRIKPINTLAHESIRKLSRISTYKELNAEQVLLGMLIDPEEWSKEPIIKIKNPDLVKLLNVKNQHIAIADLFDEQMQYVIKREVQNAYSKSPARQDKFDKAIIKLDEKVNILYMILNGDMLNIFPLKNAPDNKWYNLNNGQKVFRGEDSAFVYNVYKLYVQDVRNAIESNHWGKADSSLQFIKTYQEKVGKDVMISESKRDAEIFYNESAIFRHLFEFYFIVGLAFLVLLFVNLLIDRLQMRYLIYFFVAIITIAFGFHTYGLGLRWYIAGHAPWSNGYESMIYISWATMLAGLVFSRTSKISLAATTVLSGMILLVAHLSWIDPEITNLVPVLQSYWLTIHVAVITASYGFLALGAILGFINLLFMIIRNEGNYQRLTDKIKQLSYINEMSLIAGLFLLTIGTFLGGIWANESWGRYWGWDAKETWALITMLVYAFILHLRFIPKLKDIFTFNFLSLIAYSTVMMTYFGVNYYLSGLHSYAKGDPVPIPNFVYYTVGVVFLTAIIAWYRNKRFN